MRPTLLIWLLVLATPACGSKEKKVDAAAKAAQSWAATVKAVTEQWAQARVSLRFTRTTLTAAREDLTRRAESIRPVDAVTARRIDDIATRIGPVMDAVAGNEPDRARDIARSLPAAP